MTNQTPAPGPCPVDGCDWDAEGTLDEHLYEHDYNELRPTVVRLSLETDRLRAELEHERKRVEYWQDSRASYAAENKKLLADKKQLRAENERLQYVLQQTQQLAELDSTTCESCGHLESAHDPNGDRECDASGARIRSCACTYFIPCYPEPTTTP